MGKTFKSISRGLNEAVAYAKGKKIAVKIYTPEMVDVSVLRLRIGMTQQQFVARIGFSVAKLRHWERGDRSHPWCVVSITKHHSACVGCCAEGVELMQSI
ncbi:MAG: hypothetical protein PHG00_06470 [Methylococcales bacterium]|nr:hypothetical protein [Methylococcales bacterium]